MDIRAYLMAGIDSKFFYDRYDDYLHIGANAVVLFDNSGTLLTGWFKKTRIDPAPGDGSGAPLPF
jgi:hypothetical protein